MAEALQERKEKSEAAKPAAVTPAQGPRDQSAREAQAGRLRQYLVETRNELRKVVWPTREEAINLTTVVVAVTLLMTALLSGIDALYAAILEAVLKLAGQG